MNFGLADVLVGAFSFILSNKILMVAQRFGDNEGIHLGINSCKQLVLVSHSLREYASEVLSKHATFKYVALLF